MILMKYPKKIIVVMSNLKRDTKNQTVFSQIRQMWLRIKKDWKLQKDKKSLTFRRVKKYKYW